MCFAYDETYVVYRSTWRRARKPHNCAGCSRGIAAGELYVDHFGVMRGESPDTWNECESCRYHRALIYACERAEGCEAHESWYPIEMIDEEMEERRWYVPGITSDMRQPKDDNDEPCGGVVRFGSWRAEEPVP